MKKSIIFTAIVAAACLACNNETTTTETNDSTSTVKAEPSTAQSISCYMGNSGKDTVFLHMTEGDNKVTGNIEYRFYEKDRSTGTINGEMKGDTLLADYTYQSEGVTSTRQVAFLKQGDQLLENYGNGFVLNKVECK